MKTARIGLLITILLYFALLVVLHTVTAQAEHTAAPRIQIPVDMGTLSYRVDQLEKWQDAREAEHIPQRVEVLEQINKLDRDNRVLLWGLIGTAGLNILGTALLGFITARKRQP